MFHQTIHRPVSNSNQTPAQWHPLEQDQPIDLFDRRTPQDERRKQLQPLVQPIGTQDAQFSVSKRNKKQKRTARSIKVQCAILTVAKANDWRAATSLWGGVARTSKFLVICLTATFCAEFNLYLPLMRSTHRTCASVFRWEWVSPLLPNLLGYKYGQRGSAPYTFSITWVISTIVDAAGTVGCPSRRCVCGPVIERFARHPILQMRHAQVKGSPRLCVIAIRIYCEWFFKFAKRLSVLYAPQLISLITSAAPPRQIQKDKNTNYIHVVRIPIYINRPQCHGSRAQKPNAETYRQTWGAIYYDGRRRWEREGAFKV